MSNRRKRVNEARLPCNNEQDAWRESCPTSSQIKASIHQAVEEIFASLEATAAQTLFASVEKTVRSLVFSLGRLFLAYFLAFRHEHSRGEVEEAKKRGDFRERKPQPRLLDRREASLRRGPD